MYHNNGMVINKQVEAEGRTSPRHTVQGARFPPINLASPRAMTAFPWIEGVGGDVFADGKRLEAAAFGPPPDKAPTIVMLHEGLGCLALWRDFPQKLAAATGHGVFAYSRAGYGGSDPVDLPRPLDYMSREARFSLPALLEAIGLKRGILLGHSDGASIAAIYAGEHADERIKGLILMAPHLFTEDDGPRLDRGGAPRL